MSTETTTAITARSATPREASLPTPAAAVPGTGQTPWVPPAVEDIDLGQEITAYVARR